MYREPEFSGYWSDKDKEIWENTDWKARNYEDLPVEDTADPIASTGYFYSQHGSFTKPIVFVKYIRANSIFPPYYRPVYDTELKDFMKKGSFCYPCYDGRKEGNCDPALS